MKKRLLVLFIGISLVLVLGLTAFASTADATRVVDPKTVRVLHPGPLDPKTVRTTDPPSRFNIEIGRTAEDGQPELIDVGTTDPLVQFGYYLDPKIVRVYGPPEYAVTL
ncbi:MAG: hypothetical protein ACFFDQ_07465 [Candidatus Thorarchaeota archaeon]